MKKLFSTALLLLVFISLISQENRSDVLQGLETKQAADQNTLVPAVITTATRLFRDKEDLTSVILVIPRDSVVFVSGSDSTFMQVEYLGNEGYIYASHAELFKPSAVDQPQAEQVPAGQEAKPVQEQKVSRYTYLENKYGSSMASRIYSGKIWKGMNAQMVRDSWGSPKKIERAISGNVIMEEWFYNNTRLHFQNSTLTDWGPVK